MCIVCAFAENQPDLILRQQQQLRRVGVAGSPYDQQPPPDLLVSTSIAGSSVLPSRGGGGGGGCTPPSSSGGSSVAHSGTSAKIQRLIQTLQRSRRRPIEEFFLDSEMDDVLAPAPDPNAPKPEGPVMTPVAGEPLIVRIFRKMNSIHRVLYKCSL